MNPKHHEPLYFHDGNIVLTAVDAVGEQVAFRVHQSILAVHSPIFADMLSLPTSTGAATETYDSVPLVRMPDNAEDLKRLLEVLYCRPMLRLKRYDPNTPIIVKPLLMLATKYEIEHLRSTIIQQLEEDWPQILGAWDILELEIEAKTAHSRQQYLIGLFDPPDLCFPEPAAAIQLARQYNIHSILPAAFYHLSCLGVDSDWSQTHVNCAESGFERLNLAIGARTARWELLEREDFLCLLRGRERVKDAVARLQFFTIKHQKRMILVPRPKTYQAALDLTRKHFKTLAGKEVYFETTQADIAVGQTVELTDDVWEGIIDSLATVEAFERKIDVEVKAEPNVVARPATHNAFAAPPSPPIQPERRKIKLDLVSDLPGAQNLKVKYSVPDLCEKELRMTLEGRRPHGRNIGEDIDGYDKPYEVYFRQEQLGGKPVIYIWTPQPQEVSVDLSLTPHWSFSAAYPVAPITPTKQAGGTGQSILWNVLTREDGNLQDKATGLEVNSLFWEA
ncbi:hypothetical protein EWM64_g10543, partial [Hericium alpestre]